MRTISSLPQNLLFAFWRQNLKSGFGKLGFMAMMVFLNLNDSSKVYAEFMKTAQTIEQDRPKLTPEQESIFRKEFLNSGSVIFEGKVIDQSNINDGTTTYGILTIDIFQTYGTELKCGQIKIKTHPVNGKVKNIKSGNDEIINDKHTKSPIGFGLFSCFYDENKDLKLNASFCYLTENYHDAYLLKDNNYLLGIEEYNSVYALLPKPKVCKDMSMEINRYDPYQEPAKEKAIVIPQKVDTSWQNLLKKKIELREKIRASRKGNKSIQANVNINLNLSNPTVTSNGVDKFLEFDIMAFASQAGTYLDNGFFHPDYNTAVFGSNIFQNNKVVVTQGPTFPSPNYTIGADKLCSRQWSVIYQFISCGKHG